MLGIVGPVSKLKKYRMAEKGRDEEVAATASSATTHAPVTKSSSGKFRTPANCEDVTSKVSSGLLGIVGLVSKATETKK